MESGMRSVIAVALGALLTLSACNPATAPEAAAPAGPLFSIVIKPGALGEETGGNVDVAVTVTGMDVPAGQPAFSMGLFAPGMGKPQLLTELKASDAQGEFELSPPKGPEMGWTASRAISGDVKVSYRLPLDNAPPIAGGPPINLRIDGDGFSGQGGFLVMSPRTKQDYAVSIKWDLAAMGAGAEGVTSHGDGDIELPPGPVERINSTVFMAGHLKRQPEKSEGAFSAVWSGEPEFDPRPAMDWTAKLHNWMSGFFKDASEPNYRVFLRFNPMNAGGGAAYPHSFLVTYGNGVTGESLKSILGHEMTHTWTATGVGKWYDEGNAVFYQALLPWRAGLITSDAFLTDLNETASRYYTNAKINTPEAEVAEAFWRDTRIRVLPYDRGALYFAVLNGKIRKASGGKRSIDDLIFVMNGYRNTDKDVTEQTWLDLVKQELGEDGLAVHKTMMEGGIVLPESDDFGPCFRRVVKKIRQFDVGFDLSSLVNAEKRITGLKANSEAAKAGIRDGDVVAYGAGLDSVQADVTRTLTMQVTRGDSMFMVTYLPRGEAVDAYQWERIPGVAEETCKF